MVQGHIKSNHDGDQNVTGRVNKYPMLDNRVCDVESPGDEVMELTEHNYGVHATPVIGLIC